MKPQMYEIQNDVDVTNLLTKVCLELDKKLLKTTYDYFFTKYGATAFLQMA